MASKCDKQISTHSITNAFILQSLSSCTYRLGFQCHFVHFLVFRLTITSSLYSALFLLLHLFQWLISVISDYFQSYFQLFQIFHPQLCGNKCIICTEVPSCCVFYNDWFGQYKRNYTHIFSLHVRNIYVSHMGMSAMYCASVMKFKMLSS